MNYLSSEGELTIKFISEDDTTGKQINITFKSYKSDIEYENTKEIASLHPVLALDPSLFNNLIKNEPNIVECENKVSIAWEIEIIGKEYLIQICLEEKIYEGKSPEIIQLITKTNRLERIISKQNKQNKQIELLNLFVQNLVSKAEPTSIEDFKLYNKSDIKLKYIPNKVIITHQEPIKILKELSKNKICCDEPYHKKYTINFYFIAHAPFTIDVLLECLKILNLGLCCANIEDKKYVEKEIETKKKTNPTQEVYLPFYLKVKNIIMKE